jgi:hypothetical protein
MREESVRTHDVFLSYSSKDKTWADAACAVLERHRVRCWIAPRDITPGDEWGAAIMKGLNGSRIMVLIFSGHANASEQVRREVERAISQGMIVLPVRVEDVLPDGAMEYALGNRHWLDAFTPPVEQQLEKLAQSVKTLLGDDDESVPAPARANPGVASGSRWPHAFSLIFVAAPLIASVTLGVTTIAIKSRISEIKKKVPEKASTETERDDSVVKHKPAGDRDSSSVGAAERHGQAVPQSWVSLFDGKDLVGWKTHPSQPGDWRVEYGIIIGSGQHASHIYTERGDCKDFHLLVEARVNDGGNSGVLFRSHFGTDRPTNRPLWPSGYEAQINATHKDPKKTGSLLGLGPMVVLHESPVPPREWFILEVIAQGNHIVISINGRTTAEYTDEKRAYISGHIALQQLDPATVAEFRKIEIKAL